MSRLPNILFLMNDHQLHYRHGWDFGMPIQRPNFDRLAAGGVQFNRAYTVCPLCTPARRSILTSLYPHTHGQLQNRPSTPIRNETYLTKLREQSYRNFYFGKWHAGSGMASDFGCEGFLLPGYGNPYLSAEYKTYLQKRDLSHPMIEVERDFAHTNRQSQNAPYKQADPNGCWEHMSGIMHADDDAHEAFFLANLACDQLRQLATSDDAEPFALRVDFWSPHQPYFPTQRFADMYEPAEIQQYPSFDDDLSDKPTTYLRELNYPIGDEDGKLIRPNPLPWSAWQKVIARAYAQISLVDAAGGRILDTLDELGLADNTLVIWTSDHGDALASHGGHFNKGCYLPEEVLRIPLAVRYPKKIQAGQRSDVLVSNLDFAPTMLEAAGTTFSHSIDGQSLLPLLRGEGVEREALVCETNGHDDDTIGRTLITSRYKYIATKNDRHELYDLEVDRYELSNLIESAAHAAILRDMQAKLNHIQHQTRDPETELL